MNDNLNKEIFVEDKEIDLKDMLYYICKRWRSIGIASLVAMVVMILVKIPVLIDMKGVGVILKQLGKYAIIGVFAGLVLMCVIYAIAYVTSDKIKSENEFQTNFRLDILGVLPKIDGKKPNGMDKLIRRLFGVDRNVKDFDVLADRMAEEIKAVLSVRTITEKKILCVAVVSTDSEITNEFNKLINSRLNDIAKITTAGNILKNAESIRSVMKADIVLVVEKIATSRYHMVEEIYKKLVTWEKDVIGIVLLDGDSM